MELTLEHFIVDGEVVGAMKRQGAEGDFRSNLHQGGSATSYKLNRKENQQQLQQPKQWDLVFVELIWYLQKRTTCGS